MVDCNRNSAILIRVWVDGKPEKRLSPERFSELEIRCNDLSRRNHVRYQEIMRDNPPDERMIVGREVPTAATFFRSRHYSNRDEPSSPEDRQERISKTEQRLRIAFPPALRDLYRLQNGGHTDFELAPLVDTPEHEFANDTACYQQWAFVVPDTQLYPVETMETLGEFSDGVDFGGDETFRNGVRGADRIVILTAHGCDVCLALDYRDLGEPAVILLDLIGDGFPIKYRLPSFGAFLTRLRRLEK